MAAGAAEPIRPAAEPPSPPFNRLSDFDVIEGYLRGYARAYPDWVKLESIGKSGEGRDMWLVTLNNPATGPAESKPAMYVDGNTHANEVQGTEVVVYLIDFLLANYGRLERVTELLDRAAFYCVPVVNPDGRARWFKGPSNPHFPRTVMVPVDDDRDGLVDEDDYDDLDGDGVITEMRKKVPMGEGRFRLDPKDPRILVPVEKGELGDWIRLGPEGIDNDGDGRINEDPIGYVDPNRTWGYDWEPEYVQDGAGPYPIPSVTAWARQSKIHRLDVATVEGARVVSSGIVNNPYLDEIELQEHRPERLMVPGVPGLSSRTLFFLLEGKGEVTVHYDSLKGGKLSKKVTLR